MSFMRNAAPRPTHRERSQPQSRQKWGLLEKHKDYSLRAADYNLKKRKLATLAQKARDRHPDEFAFGMVSKGSDRAGKHGRGVGRDGEGTGRLGVEAVKLLKSQDAGYLRVVAGRGRREIERAEQEGGVEGALKMSGKENGRKKVFEDEVLNEVVVSRHELQGEDGQMDVDEDKENELETEKHAASRPQSKTAQGAQQKAIFDLRKERKRRQRLAESRAKKLEMLRKRQKEILKVADQLELQRAKMANTVGGVNKDGVKFKIRERKR